MPRRCNNTRYQVIEQLGLVTTDATGQPVFDFAALTAALHERFEDYVGRNGGRGGAAEAAAAAAVRAALRYAQQVRQRGAGGSLSLQLCMPGTCCDPCMLYLFRLAVSMS